MHFSGERPPSAVAPFEKFTHLVLLRRTGQFAATTLSQLISENIQNNRNSGCVLDGVGVTPLEHGKDAFLNSGH